MSAKKTPKAPAKKPAQKRTVQLDPTKLTEAEHSADKLKEVLETGQLTPPAEGEIMVPENQDHDQPAADAETEKGLQLLKEGHADLSLVGGVSTDQLRQALTVQTEQRALIKAFIQHHLVEGTDYGQIHVVKSCPDETKRRGSCTKSYHLSKRVLFKPGQEKIFSLFSITDTLERDVEAYEMLGEQPGLVAYKCLLYRSGSEKPVGHGRGAASVGEQGRNVNSTIKIAEKRARMDACLSLGFSEYFAQDLDDPDYKQQAQQANERAAAEAEARDKDDLGLWIREPSLAMDDSERKLLFATIKHIGYDDPDSMLRLLEANGVPNVKTMNSGIARSLIRKFRAGEYVPITVQLDPVIDVDTDAPITADDIPDLHATEPKPSPISQEAELIVDDQFKRGVIEQFESLGLTARGIMWFKQRALGKPYGDWDKTNEHDWRKIYAVLQDILDMRLDVPEEYIAGFIPDHGSDLDGITQTFGEDIQVLDPAQPGGGH